MRTWYAMFAALAACGACAAPASAQGSARAAAAVVLLGDCGGSSYGGHVAPQQWDRGCTGVYDLTKMVWAGWGGAVATGTGTAQLNDCVPYCAEGTVYEYPVEAQVSEIRRCKDSEGRAGSYYTRVRTVILIPADNPFGLPAGPSEQVSTQGCILPSAPNRCGGMGQPPGNAYDITASGIRCTPARALVRKARARRCPQGRCAIARTIRVDGFRCRFNSIPRGRYYQNVRCVRGSQRVSFRIAFD